MANGIDALSRLQCKVDSNNALVVTLDSGSVIPNLTVDQITFSGGQFINGATANTMIFSATGPYIYGSSSSGTPQWQWTLNGTYLPTGVAPIGGMMRLSPTITVPAAMAMRGYSQQPTFDFNNQTLSMDEVNAFEIDASPLTNKAGVTLHNLASLQIFGAMDPTGLAGFTGKSYSLWINDSITGIANTRIDGTLYLGATARADISATNAVQITHTGPTMNVLRGDGTAGGGVSTSTGTFDTAVIVADGTTAIPSVRRSASNTGWAFDTNLLRGVLNGTLYYDLSNTRLTLYQNTTMGFSSAGGSADAVIGRLAAGRFRFVDAATTTGVALDITTNSTANFLTIAGGDTAIVKVNVVNATGKYQINGVDGASFSGAVTNITVVNGLVTAAS